jgi:hypothetical protein
MLEILLSLIIGVADFATHETREGISPKVWVVIFAIGLICILWQGATVTPPPVHFLDF